MKATDKAIEIVSKAVNYTQLCWFFRTSTLAFFKEFK